MADIYSTSRTAQILDISTNTLKRWYKWYESDEFKKPEGLVLPPYTNDARGTKFFTMESIQALLKFKEDLQGCYRGCMSDFNAHYQWGERGKTIMQRKGQNNEPKKSKLRLGEN